MIFLYFGLYTLIIAIIWGFFIVVRIHSLKFDNFQTKIRKVVRAICFTLVVGTILGYLIIYTISTSDERSIIKPFENINLDNMNDILDSTENNYY